MTRARDHLHVIVPQRFFVHGQRSGGDRHMYAGRTRFIPAGLIEHFESCSWPRAAAAEAVAKSARAPVDIRQRLRKVWG
jgi:DNA helicase-2/ATP-dependent DNA helicase PcrA